MIKIQIDIKFGYVPITGTIAIDDTEVQQPAKPTSPTVSGRQMTAFQRNKLLQHGFTEEQIKDFSYRKARNRLETIRVREKRRNDLMYMPGAIPESEKRKPGRPRKDSLPV